MNRIYTLLGTAVLALSLEAMEQPPKALAKRASAVDWTRDTLQMGTIETEVKSLIAASNNLETAINKIRCYALQNKNVQNVLNYDYELNKEFINILAKKFTNGDIFTVAKKYQTPAIAKYIEKKFVKTPAYELYVEKDTNDFILAIYAGNEQLATQLAQKIRKSAYRNNFDIAVQALYNSFAIAHQTKNRATQTLRTYLKTQKLLIKLGARSKFGMPSNQ